MIILLTFILSSLINNYMPDLLGYDKIKVAIERFKTFEPPDGYFVAFSGGKDSIVIKSLAEKSGVAHETVYNNTTIDPPELTKYIRQHHPDVRWNNPPKPFLRRVVEKGFPLRQRRWCCEEYKERGGEGRLVVTGVRWAESARRKSRRMVETCMRGHAKQYLHVIIEWTNEDVWNYIKQFNLPYCSLYDNGFRRVGCVMCPMSYNRKRESERWPKYREAFRRAFNRLYENKKGTEAYRFWRSGDEMFEWWLEGKSLKNTGRLPRSEDPQQVIFE